ncbi:hypothetical protein NDU88_004619, partial [Pleurodeles waltl]
MSILGKCFQDTCLRDLCIEKDTIAGGSILSVLEGHMYNCGVWVHKSVCEAMLRLAWLEFIPWVEKNYKENIQVIYSFFEDFNDFAKDLC